MHSSLQTPSFCCLSLKQLNFRRLRFINQWLRWIMKFKFNYCLIKSRSIFTLFNVWVIIKIVSWCVVYLVFCWKRTYFYVVIFEQVLLYFVKVWAWQALSFDFNKFQIALPVTVVLCCFFFDHSASQSQLLLQTIGWVLDDLTMADVLLLV